ncbi:DMT family transporter [Actinotalea sp. Marseille-Q4924]|uniref:DMT family transporter n=1 Tax=Actinotalea sp. Marseille-Q4924 TaxID=2866571 RepID=UPI001CE48ED8|nr:DMT family transporter [Actinotalea sp. Marseille-Q4924]
MGDALALGALLMFSCNSFVVRAATHRLDQRIGFLVALAANVVVAGLAALVQLAVRGGFSPVVWSAVLWFVLAGLFASYLGRRGYFRSVQTMGPSRAAAVQVINPAFAALFAWVLLREGLGRVDLASMVVIIVGLLLTNRVPRSADALAARGPGERGRRMEAIPPAILLPAVLAAVWYALGNVTRGGAVRAWPEPVLGGLIGGVAGIAVYLLFHVDMARLRADLRQADRRGLLLWGLAGGLAIGGQIMVIGATLYIPVAVAVAISAAVPVVVIPASVVFLRDVEQIRPATVVGALLIVGGVATLVLR